MTRRLLLPFLMLFALAVAGCGGGDDGGSSGSLGDSLGYLPKNAPVVVTVDTDLEDPNYKNLDAMLKKFPFTGQVKTQLKQSIQQSGADYDKDVKPLLGNEAVIGLPDPRAIVDDAMEDKYVIVFPTKDGGKMKSLIEKGNQRKSGQIDGKDVYESADGSALILDGDTVIGANTRAELEAAVERSGGDDKLTEEDFNAPFEGLPAEAPMRVYGDAQALLQADPETAEARQVKWVDGLRKFAFTATAQKDGVAIDGKLVTEGLTQEDVPLASGDEAVPVSRFGDFATGIRDVGHATDWLLDVVAKSEGENYDQLKTQLNKQLGIDLDRDVIEQLSGNSTVAGQLDGTVAIRSEVKDPDAMRATLAKLRKSKGGGDTRITPAGDLLKATDEDGDELYFGMEGDVLVASPESVARAKAIAGVEPQPVPGAKGSVVFAADGETIAKTAIQQSGQNQAAGLFTGPLGDVTAWISAAPEGLRMNAKLTIE